MLTGFSWVCVFAGLVPLAVLWLERRRGYRRVWWLLGTAFSVSTVADLARTFGAPPWTVSAVFPLSQFGFLFLALAGSWTAAALLMGLATLATWAVLRGAWERPDATLTVAGGMAVVGLLSRAPSRTRFALAVYFGLGAAAWFWYCTDPGTAPYLVYQWCRLIGLAAVTVEVWREH